MGLKVCSLSSGSSGNCIYVSSETTALLIDSGVSVSHVLKSLKALKCGLPLSLLVTHTHSDHISGVPKLCNELDINVYTHFLSTFDVKKKLKQKSLNLREFEDDFTIGDILISPFRVSHDVPTVGYSLISDNKKISILTDLGYIDELTKDKISDSDIILIEANHDEELVRSNYKYPISLKQRILSSRGHLSNEACANAVVSFAKSGVKQVILAHLSKENNYPELAFNTVSRMLRENGIIEGVDIKIEVAPASRLSGLYEVV